MTRIGVSAPNPAEDSATFHAPFGCACRARSLRRQSEFAQFSVQISLADPENPGGVPAVTAADLERQADVGPFQLVQRRQTGAVGGLTGPARDGRRYDGRRQVSRKNLLAFAHHHRGFDGVQQRDRNPRKRPEFPAKLASWDMFVCTPPLQSL